MSASQRGTGLRQAFRCLRHLTVSALRPLISDLRITVASIKARRATRRRMVNLQALNSHTVRDIGLMRDRFTGTLRNDLSGEILDHQVRPAEDRAQAEARGFRAADLHMIERRRADRRVSERRFAVRRGDSVLKEPGLQKSAAVRDRRAFNRRASDRRVLDGSEVFPGRPRLLLA